MSLMENMIKLCIEIENSKRLVEENNLSNLYKTSLKSKSKLVNIVKNLTTIVGIFIIDPETYDLANNTWIKNIKSLQEIGYQFKIIWITTSDGNRLYYDILTDILYLPRSKFRSTMKCKKELRDKFLNYCRLYVTDWVYIFLTQSSCYINLEKFITSNFNYYHRYGDFIWHYTLIDHYFKYKKMKTPVGDITLTSKYFTNNFTSNFYDDIELNEIQSSKFKIKDIQLAVPQNPYFNYLIDHSLGVILYFNLYKLLRYISYDYGYTLTSNKKQQVPSMSTFFNLHNQIEALSFKLNEIIEDDLTLQKKLVSLNLHFYNLELNLEDKITYSIDTIPHLHWGSLIILTNYYDSSYTLFKDSIFLQDGNFLRIFPGEDNNELFTPVFSGDLIIFQNLSTSEVESKYYIYKYGDLVDDDKNIKFNINTPLITKSYNNYKTDRVIKVGTEVILLNKEKTGYLKYKNNEYKFKLFADNNDNNKNIRFSKKGIWKFMDIK